MFQKLNHGLRRRLVPTLIVLALTTAALRIGTLIPWLQAAYAAEEPLAAELSEPEAPAETEAAKSVADSLPRAADGSIPDDFVPYTATEVDLLEQLGKRRQALDARERELDLREEIVAAAEAKLTQRVQEMEALRSELQDMVKTIDAQDQEELRRLVKIYETMKPKDAARIFDTLELGVLLPVLEGMRELKAAPVLAEMSGDRAREVTAKMAERERVAASAFRAP